MEEPTLVGAPETVWAPGGALGRYSLVAKLAVGGMAEIWLARQAGPRGFEKVIVIKKVSDAFTNDPEFVEMFLDEARIAAQLSHPNIVQIYDLGEQAGSYYIAMEYLPGENLASVMRAGRQAARPLPLGLAARVIAQAADALGHAHTKMGLDGKPLNVVHRDVSPQNLIVTYDGVLKIVDFGIAKAANRATHTVGNQLKGKVSYLSPEQARGREVDGRSDVFALGIVLFEVTTRTRLFQFDDPVRALAVIAGDQPLPTARSRNPEIPQALDAIISRALEREPATRYQTARDFQVALEDWLRTLAEPSGSADIAAYMRSLFAEKMTLRSQLFEQALRGELTPSRLRPSFISGGSQKSMPGGTQQLAAPSRRRGLLILAAVSALAVGAVVALAWRGIGGQAPEPALVDVLTEPPGAQVSVDGSPQGTSPLTLELTAGTHEVAAELPGRQRASRILKSSGGDHQKLALTLAALPTVAAAPAPTPPPTLMAKAEPLPEPPHPKVVAPVRRGRLSLDTTPWTRVLLNGRELGDTPLLEVPVPAGRHVLQLVNDQKGIKSSVEVDIEPGKTTVKKLRL